MKPANRYLLCVAATYLAALCLSVLLGDALGWAFAVIVDGNGTAGAFVGAAAMLIGCTAKILAQEQRERVSARLRYLRQVEAGKGREPHP